MNLFETIFNKAKSGVDYLATGQAGSDLYDWANPETQDPIQRFLDDPAMDMSKKQALMDNLKSGVPTDVMKSYVTEKYYKQPEFKQTVPTVSPTFPITGEEGLGTTMAKQIGNFPSSLYNFGATGVNIASTAYQEGIPETAGMLGRGIIKSAGEGAQNVATSYQDKGLVGATNTVLEGAIKTLAEDPASWIGAPLVKPAVVGTGKAIVRGAEKVAPVTKTIIKKPVQIVKNKAIDVFGKELRPVQDIAGNILQPYKGMVENLDDATAGLRRVVDETGTKTDTFEGLLGKIEETQKKYGQMKQESLGGIVQTRKSASAQKALENLDSVYANVSSKDMLATKARVKELARKNMNEGLTPLEMDEVKVLHTKSNNLFNEKGQATGGFSSDDMRGVRRDLKEEIEQFAEENGVSNIREINKAYGEISDARTLAQNQVDNLRSYKGRQIPATRVQKIADFIMEFPVVKQAFADPARILASSIFKTLRGDKINPIEVQKRLPEFLKELKDAGMKAGDMQKVEKMIQNEIKLLPPASKEALLSEKISQPDITKKSIIRQPTTPTKKDIQLTKQAQRQAQVKEVERELNTALKSNYNPNKPEATKAFIERNITQGKITREEAISMVENLYDKANGFDKPHYEKMLNDLYSNKKIESFDDLLNEKQVAKEVKTPRQEFLETPEGIYKEINKKANDRRYNPEKANILIEKFKEKTGIDLMKNPIQKFDEKGNVVKPNSTTNAKQPRNIVEPSTKSDSDIPEGYFKNAFGEIVKNPSNKNGGFIRNPFAKPEPKRLFAGENSAQPPKGKTGWFKGADGKMRFEIDDSGAKVNANVDLTKNAKAVYLKSILEHKELYKNYPELSDTSVLFDKSLKEGLAHFDTKTGAIHLSYDEFINPNTGKIWGAGSYGTHDNIKTKLLHEIQHAIQETEGFAKGGSAGRELQDWAYNEQSYVRKITKLLQEDLSKIESNPRLKKAFSLLDNEMTKENPNFSKIENEYKDVLKPYQNLSKDIARQKDMEKALDSNDYELYKNLAGEVEARNVQSRMNLTAKERTLKSPESTEDVPRAKQIIRMDSKGPAMSIKSPDSGLKEIQDIKKVAENIFGDEFRLFQAKRPISQIEEIARDDYWKKPEVIKKVNQIKERILRGEELPPLIADRRVGDKVTPYSIVDGLHRMKALEELGYKGDVEIIYPLGKKISSDSLFYEEPYMQKIDLGKITQKPKPLSQQKTAKQIIKK